MYVNEDNLQVCGVKAESDLNISIICEGGACWVRVAISTCNIFRLRNTVKKRLQWLGKRVEKKTLKFNVTHCGQWWFRRTLGNQSFTEKWTFTEMHGAKTKWRL